MPTRIPIQDVTHEHTHPPYAERARAVDVERLRDDLGRVEPGTILDELRHAAERHGLTFGPDPSTHNHCTLGGMIGNNSCGVHSVMAQFAGTGPRTSDQVEWLDILSAMHLADVLQMAMHEGPAGPAGEYPERACVPDYAAEARKTSRFVLAGAAMGAAALALAAVARRGRKTSAR